MKIGIVGNGVVGHATARAFMEFAEVKIYDTVPEKRTHTLPEVTSCDIVFVCLPTPQKEGSNECDLSAVDDFFKWHEGFKAHFVLRSTVPIGTTKRLAEKYRLPNLVHSPEFLTARCAVVDAQTPARNVVGFATRDFGLGNKNSPNLVGLYQTRYPGIACHVMTSDESEAMKLFQNSFFAVKVAFFNELNTLCEKLHLDWKSVLDAMLADGRIAHSHTKVPGPDGQYGYGGTCLPKDIANLRECFKQAQVAEMVCSAAAIRNECYDRKRV